MGKLTANGDESVDAGNPGKPEIHQRDVWPMTPEFLYSRRAVAGLRNQQHVPLRRNNRIQAFAENRVVFNAQDPKGLGFCHCNCRRLNIVTRKTLAIMSSQLEITL